MHVSLPGQLMRFEEASVGDIVYIWMRDEQRLGFVFQHNNNRTIAVLENRRNIGRLPHLLGVGGLSNETVMVLSKVVVRPNLKSMQSGTFPGTGALVWLGGAGTYMKCTDQNSVFWFSMSTGLSVPRLPGVGTALSFTQWDIGFERPQSIDSIFSFEAQKG